MCYWRKNEFKSLKGEEISYRYTLDQARDDENQQAILELSEIGNPPYNDIWDLMTQHKWLSYYGGVERTGKIL